MLTGLSKNVCPRQQILLGDILDGADVKNILIMASLFTGLEFCS